MLSEKPPACPAQRPTVTTWTRRRSCAPWPSERYDRSRGGFVTARSAHQGAWQRLRAGCRAYIDYAVEHPHHYQLVFGDTPIAEPDPRLEEAADDAMAAVGELVVQAQDSGLLRPGPTREIATVVWVLLHGLAALQITGHLHEPRTIDGDEHLADLLDLALEQLRPS